MNGTVFVSFTIPESSLPKRFIEITPTRGHATQRGQGSSTDKRALKDQSGTRKGKAE